MGKKIMILNGSPRANGNTALLIEAFTKGAESAGHSVVTFSLDAMDIHGCKGCYCGGKDPESPCVQKDDMDKIYPVYKQADIVVLASPLYFWNLSGQLCTALDRLFAVAECDPHFRSPVKKSILLMAAEGCAFEDCISYYDSLMKHLNWESLGKVLCGGVLAAGDAKGKPEIAEAEALGRSIR